MGTSKTWVVYVKFDVPIFDVTAFNVTGLSICEFDKKVEFEYIKY